MQIGKEIRFIRRFNGLTLRELGNASGIKYSRLSKFECGIEIPIDENLKKLGEALNIDFIEFFQVSNAIDKLCDEFFKSLFYHDQNHEVFKAKISMGKSIHEINYSYGKVQLIEYIMLVLEGEFKKARRMENELFEYFKNEPEYEAILFQYKGLSYRFEKRYIEAITWFEKAESQMLNRKNRAMLMIHSSIAYSKSMNIPKAMQYVGSAHKIFSEYGSFRRVFYCFVEYGLLLKSNKQYNQAIDCFNIALDSTKIVNCSEDVVAKVHRNMCWTMILAGNYKTALEYLDQAKAYDSKHGFTVLYGIWCHYKLKNYNEAEKIINKNIHLKKDVNFARFYELFNLLVVLRENEPSNEIIKVAIKVINDIKDNEEYERVNFYIDIVLDLLNRSGNEFEKIKYLEMKINLTK